MKTVTICGRGRETDVSLPDAVAAAMVQAGFAVPALASDFTYLTQLPAFALPARSSSTGGMKTITIWAAGRQTDVCLPDAIAASLVQASIAVPALASDYTYLMQLAGAAAHVPADALVNDQGSYVLNDQGGYIRQGELA